MGKITPCDVPVLVGYDENGVAIIDIICPFNAAGRYDCEYYCGLGVPDADEFDVCLEEECYEQEN